MNNQEVIRYAISPPPELWAMTDEELTLRAIMIAKKHMHRPTDEEVLEQAKALVAKFRKEFAPVNEDLYSREEEQARINQLWALKDEEFIPAKYEEYKSAFPWLGRGDYQDYLDRLLTQAS